MVIPPPFRINNVNNNYENSNVPSTLLLFNNVEYIPTNKVKNKTNARLPSK
nr:MAG TPA: hypothetical protein [Caudoviricetes sp.]